MYVRKVYTRLTMTAIFVRPVNQVDKFLVLKNQLQFFEHLIKNNNFVFDLP
jgi:hypothetical protein